LEIIFGSIFNIYHITPILCCTTGVGGGASPPQKFWFGENPGKLHGNQGKIFENLHKISENLSKPLKIWAKMAPKITWVFLRSLFYGVFLRVSLGEFGQKSFAAPKCACSYTYVLHHHRFRDFFGTVLEIFGVAFVTALHMQQLVSCL